MTTLTLTLSQGCIVEVAKWRKIMRTQLRIGEIAQLLGITPKAVRHYQKVGLLVEPARSESGYRLYGAQDLLRLQRIRRLQALGLSLKQIKAVLGDPNHEHTLREVLQFLDAELSTQMRELEERREKIRCLIAENTLDAIDQPLTGSPTFKYIQAHLVDYNPLIHPALLEHDAKLYALLENFHWTGNQQNVLKEMAPYVVEHFTQHPEEYQALLTLSERLMALALLSDDAPEVEQLAEDFIQYFVRYPFLHGVQKQVPHEGLQSPFSDIFSELLTPIFSPAQRKVLEALAHRLGKEHKT
jgi:DNA-binding transcriptional MerR regulator